MIDVPESQAIPLRINLASKLAVTAGLTAFGDWLFYDRNIGFSLALFLFGLAAASLMTRTRRNGGRLFLGIVILISALLPLAVQLRLLSLLVGIVGTVLAAAVLSGALDKGVSGLVATAQRLLMKGPFQLIPDLVRAGRDARLKGSYPISTSKVTGWIVPILCCCVFLALFMQANPMIEQWLSMFDPSRQQWHVDALRTYTWIVLVALAWPFVAMRLSDGPPFGSRLLSKASGVR